MKVLDDFSNIFTRYDLRLEKTGEAKEVSKDPILQEIAKFVFRSPIVELAFLKTNWS